MDLEERFTKHENILEGFSAFFNDISENDELDDKFIKTVEFYQQFNFWWTTVNSCRIKNVEEIFDT